MWIPENFNYLCGLCLVSNSTAHQWVSLSACWGTSQPRMGAACLLRSGTSGCGPAALHDAVRGQGEGADRSVSGLYFLPWIYSSISGAGLCLDKSCNLSVSFLIVGRGLFIILDFHNIQVFSTEIIFRVRSIYLQHLFRSAFTFGNVL